MNLFYMEQNGKLWGGRRCWLAVAVLLVGCGPQVLVTDVSAPEAVKLNSSVIVIDGTPPANARSVGSLEATSCRNKTWDPPATEENAILQLKAVATRMGGNAIANVYCEPPLGMNVGKNCWSSIRCTATAYKMPG